MIVTILQLFHFLQGMLDMYGFYSGKRMTKKGSTFFMAAGTEKIEGGKGLKFRLSW